MEHLTALLRDLGPWALTFVGAWLAKLLRHASKRIESIAATQVKADLAFEEVSTRIPEYKARFATWAEHR